MGAIDFGIIVDATVIMVENIFRHLAEAQHKRPAGNPRARPIRRTACSGKLATICHASGEVTQAIFFSATIIIAGFLPLFTLSGVEGHIFGPMAKTYAYALSGGLLATFTVSPALCALLLPGPVSGDRDRRSCASCVASTARSSTSCWSTELSSLTAGAGLAARRWLLRRQLGRAGIPAQARGGQHVDPRRPCRASISLEEGNDYANRMRKLIKSFPEVETVDLPARPAGRRHRRHRLLQREFFVPLKPFDKWRKGMDKEKLIDRDERRASKRPFPASSSTSRNTSRTTSQEAASGVKGENSVKVFGPDLETLAKVAAEIKQRDGDRARHHRSCRSSASLGQPTIRIDIDRAARGALRACRRATSTPPSRRRSAARRRAISTRTAATATSP